MSANFTAAYPHSWLQPVQYDLDEYRLFAAGLDSDLADLLAAHATRGACLCGRQVCVGLDRDTPSDSQPPSPPGQSSSF